ncbi:hypothetical protein [Thalassoroseus pseudoceratinae]|uniref:hypothetical protein n=1 Tax=Thalassoroseus pseudoceratinae TaxID=2713176 RepID=UPI001423EEB4|nr:hypothetical protein [Thalassoroseus pseudoceratinae]
MMAEQLFNLGQIVATPGALETLEGTSETPLDFIRRHAAGDWGDVCKEDAEANNEALWNGERIFSVYHTKIGRQKLYCITEADRNSTCLLLPDEY